MAYEKFEKVLRNVDRLTTQNVTPLELKQYLNSEGFSLDKFTEAAKNYSKAKGVESEYGLVKAGLQGLTFGFSDEAEAAVKTLLNKQPYEQNLGSIQFAKQQYEAENPIKAATAEVIGSLPTAFAAGAGAVRLGQLAPKAMQAIQALPNTLKTLAGVTGSGAGFGAITGAGTSEEGKRLEAAKQGATTGAVLAPVTLGVVKGATGAVSKVSEKIGLPEAAQKIVEVTKDIPVVKQITGKTAEYLGLSAESMQRKADSAIIQALQRDNIALPEIRRIMDEIRASGYKPETIMEFGGKATKQLGETVASYPGARVIAETMAEERKAGAGNRILTDFQKAFNIDKDPMEIADAIIKLRQATSAPLYEKAYSSPVSIGNKTIDNIMLDPAFQNAYARANRIASREGFPIAPLKTEGNSFDLKTIDYIKRGIDDEINWSKTPASGLGKDEVNSLKNVRGKFMTEVDAQAPKEYKQAREAYSGQSQIYDAIENGKGFFDLDARQLKKTYDALTPGEKDGFAIGAYDAIRMKLREGADGIDLVKRTFGSPEKRDQIQVLIGKDAFSTLENQLGREKAIRTQDIKMLGGSQTQQIGRAHV